MNPVKIFLKSVAKGLGFEFYRVGTLREVLARFNAQSAFHHILDVGANVGQTAELYSRWFPGAVVHSIEPYSGAFEQLQNLARAHPTVRPYHLALGEFDANHDLYVNEASYTNSFLPATNEINELLRSSACRLKGTEAVDVLTLPSFCRAQGIDCIDLLKLDTQGYEDRILRGASEWLSPDQIRLIYMEVNFVRHYQGQADFGEIFSLLGDAGYRLYSWYETYANQHAGILWSNALFVPCR